MSFPIPQFTNADRHQQLAQAYPRLRDIFQTFMEKGRIPGLAWGVVVDGELAIIETMGVRYAGQDTPVQPDTVFRIASMTKSLTAMAILRLRDDGRLNLESPAAEYVPELATLPYPTRDSAPITVRQLLTMSVGFPQDDPWADRQLAANPDDVNHWLKQGISFSNPPGITFEYSNFGYGLLGRIITNVSGMPYQAYVRQVVLEPLGMSSSTFDVTQVEPARLAMGHRLEGEGWAEDPPLADGEFGSMGGLFTTIPDFARYMAFLLSAFPSRDDDDPALPVRRSSAREMQQIGRVIGVQSWRPSPDAAAVVQVDGYGYGLSCGIDSRLGYSVMHGGGLPGYGSFYRLLPERGVGVVAFANLTYAGPYVAIADALLVLQETGGLTPRVLPTAPLLTATRDALANLYERWDDEAAQQLASESFFQDMPLAKRREQFTQLRSDLGACQSISAIEPLNALRGRWQMICERGRVDVFATHSPTVPPRLQYLTLTIARPLSQAMVTLLNELMALARQWDEARFLALADPTLIPTVVEAQWAALRIQYGALQMGEPLESDGANTARVRLTGERGGVDMRLALDPETGRLREITFTRPRETQFVP